MTRSITLDDIARFPKPGWAIPTNPAFSPDGRLVTYLHSPEGSLVQQLYAFDPHNGRRFLLVAPAQGATEENLSLEERLRRERMRQRELGITSYAWAPGRKRLLVPLPDGVYVQDGEGSEPIRVVGTEQGPVLDPRFSPDGEWIAFVQASELWVVPADGSGPPHQLTFGARESGLTHGLAEFVAQEEMDRSKGYWWSPDNRQLAFEEVDETHIPVYRIVHQGQDQTGGSAQEDHHYPFAGQDNAKVRLGVVGLNGGEPTWINLGQEEAGSFYLARVNWLPNGDLAVQVENREQTRLDLLRINPTNGQPVLLLRESSDVWINLNDAFRPIKKGPFQGMFLWASERTGFCHLYLYDGQGTLVRALTAGDWMIEELVGVDEEKGIAYVTGTRDGPLEAHLYAVSLKEGTATNPRRITVEPGTHQVTLDSDCQCFIDLHHALDTPPHINLRSLADGALLAAVYEQTDPVVSELALEPPEIVTLQNREGVLLYGAIYRPSAGSAPYPVVVSVYGGPHAQVVANSWMMTIDMRAQHLRQQGFLVFMLDNRGAARRGLAFEGAIWHNMGDLEVKDQVDGVRWLTQQGLVDNGRVGIYGWSYGGYMSAMSLARAPETFRAAVAGAPVTHWDGYDTHYTERYMGTPQSNPEGYAKCNVMHYADQIQGKLLLIHGLIDENVHFRHTARLINALIRTRKTYQLLLFPDERHMPRRIEDRVYMEEQIVDFLKKNI